MKIKEALLTTAWILLTLISISFVIAVSLTPLWLRLAHVELWQLGFIATGLLGVGLLIIGWDPTGEKMEGLI